MSSYAFTLAFHKAFGLPIRKIEHGNPPVPTVEERILRAKLLFEETMETIEKGLGVRVYTIFDGANDYTVTHNTEFEIDGDYDPVETLDGLADVKVIANGTAVQFGLPMQDADVEVFQSNMSKLGLDGKPIMNVCMDRQYHASDDPTTPEECNHVNHLLDPRQPKMKALKPAHYTPANIRRVLGLK